jgi:putative FmdB family regulatory protein
MPFYEYQCKSCGHTLEAMQKINDSPLKKCPHCGKSQLTRLMSAPVFRLKGGGWYETDFKGDQDNRKNLADRPEAEAAKDDTKPAADAKTDATAKDVPKKESAATGEAKTSEKSADKPAVKPAPETTKKAGGGISRRGTSGASKPVHRKVPKKSPAKKKARR